jgi:hypothetical protein
MKTLILLVVFITATCSCGCSPHPASESTSADSNESAASPLANAPSSTEQDVLEFDPKLTLAWPGPPEESRRRANAGLKNETTIYSATFSQTGPVTIFGANVVLLSEEDLQTSDPKTWLPYHHGGPEDEELSRQQIEQGPHKHLGFELRIKSNNAYCRRINVLAGRRLYCVEVTSLNRERLDADDVTNFLQSFSVKD